MTAHVVCQSGWYRIGRGLGPQLNETGHVSLPGAAVRR